MKDGQLIRPAGRISTIAEINEANANRIPIDHGLRDKFASVDIDRVYPPDMEPVGDLVVSKNALDVSVAFDEVFDPNGGAYCQAITWGDGEASMDPTSPASHSYASAGTYVISAYFEDANGSVAQLTETVTVA